ncbi:putative isomerase [Quercus suber]|uniref:Isomerase n=1 Tax=Quercus suber TaxID=58331 RepID=A0AAW0K4S9_QUESU|nr:putative isomerase [Quercus suber]
MAKKPVKYYVVDAFTESAFKGNPAAVCLLEEEDQRDEKWFQVVAAEFNISTTCYLTQLTHSGSPTPQFRIRWFSPVVELQLCGHATLVAAHTIFASSFMNSSIVEFVTVSGIVTARRVSTISNALNGASVIDIKRTTTKDDIVLILPSGQAVEELPPQFDAIRKCPGRGIIISGVAPLGSRFDYYYRYFGSKIGINEDPVNGSANYALTPYWSKKLGKCDLVAYAASPRGGVLNIHLDEQNQIVLLRGKAITVMEGSLLV